jgi:16S rRNA (adenine1518-N6/adenine1519-N6)-dimethyltransferase
VLVQLTSRRDGFRAVSRTSFRPPPNVDSALVALERTRPWGAEYPWVKRVVQGAFAHRRKTLANSLELAGVRLRPAVGDALARLGHSSTVRAEELAPDQLAALAEALR